MPVYKCSNGKYRVGNSDCIYDTKEKAESVWKALLSKGIYAASVVSFDFDDTLTLPKYQEMAKRMIANGVEVHIVTRRQETANEEVFKLAKEIGIARSNIHFTNGKMKWEYLNRSNIKEHYDNNPKEIELINANTDVKGILANGN
jgi:hypothetical protein